MSVRMDRIFLMSVALFAAPAEAQCRLCVADAVKGAEAPSTPLRIDVEATLDLGRAAHVRAGGGGTISLDPTTGERRVGGGLTDLGGFSLKGTVRLSGEPFAPVAVNMPNRIPLAAADGSTADVINVRTTLAPNARLDTQGQLSFSFGGQLIVTAGQAGDFRGRITVIADYR